MPRFRFSASKSNLAPKPCLRDSGRGITAIPQRGPGTFVTARLDEHFASLPNELGGILFPDDELIYTTDSA